jgi:hypothetical protein
MVGVVTLVVLCATTATPQSEEPKNVPKLDELATAGAKFGVTFFKGLGASYRAGEAERAYASARSNGLLQNDLSYVAEAYKTQRDEARATADFTHSAGGVFIPLVVGAGLISGVGTVAASGPTPVSQIV